MPAGRGCMAFRKSQTWKISILINSVDYELIFLQNILITCQLNNNQSMRPLLYFNGARVPHSARTALMMRFMRSQVISQDY